MSTLSVPLTPGLEEVINQLVIRGYAASKAAVVRRALQLLAEEEAAVSVLRAEQEMAEGKTLRGDLKKLARRIK